MNNSPAIADPAITAPAAPTAVAIHASRPAPPLSLVPRVPKAAAAPDERPQLCRIADLLGAWEADAQAAFDARVNGVPRGPVTGLSGLDRELGGSFVSGLHFAHGQPGVGKSALALQVAASCGCPCIYLTCEMAPLELLKRLTARTTNTYLGRLKSGEIAPQDSLALARRAAAATPQLTLMDGTRAYASPSYLRECAQIVKGESRHLLIVVDSLHSWAESAPATGATEYDTLNVAVAALRHVAAEENCAIFAIAERNRGAMNSGGLSAGAGTRKIEYGAETVLELERAEANGMPITGAGGEVEVKAKLSKNRHGAAGKSVQLAFHGALQRFQEA